MAAVIGFENIVDEFKQLYISKRHSDVQIKVSEVDEVTHVIEAHAIVLEMNSTYFRNLLIDRKKGEVEFEIKLKTGQGKFMEILVSGFYDRGFLNNFSMNDILCVLELAVMYTNDEFLKNVTQHLEDVEIDYNICCATSNKIYSLEDDNLNVELTNVKGKCTKFLAKLFSPIEMKHQGFLMLEYAPLLYLLQSDEVFSISENSLLTFIILWLEYDITRQKGSIIESLLICLRLKFLSCDYLFSTIAKQHHVILSKWDGFNGWIYSCLGVLGMSAYQRECKYPNVDKQVSRNVAHGIQSWYQNYIMKQVSAIRWLVRMTPEIASERFGPTEHTFIHDGFNFCPTLVSITLIEGDNTKYNMNLSIKCSASIAGIRFVVGIVLADKDYDISKIFFHSEFARNFLKWSDVYAFDGNTIVVDYWTASKDFIDKANEHGLCVCLLPVTQVEIDGLQNMNFLCGRCSQCYCFITAGSTCPSRICLRQSSCSTYSKIHLS